MSRHKPMEETAQRAETEALNLGQVYVGTEHLLLAILQDEDGAATTALIAAGGEPDRIRKQVMTLLLPQSQAEAKRPLPRTPRAGSALQLAQKEATEQGLGADEFHLLRALLQDLGSAASQSLVAAGVDVRVLNQTTAR